MIESADSYTVTLALRDLQGDPITGEGFTVSYAEVDPFFDFDLNPLEVDIHETLPTSPGATLAGDGTIDLTLKAGSYYLVRILDDGAGGNAYLEHRVYLYAHTDYDGQTLTAHVSTAADVTASYTARSVAEPEYDLVNRGFLTVNYTPVAAAAPWSGSRDVSFYGLEVSFLPTGTFGADEGNPFVYQMMMLDDTGSTTADSLGVMEASMLDFTANTTQPFPEFRELYAYSSWEGTSWEQEAGGEATNADRALVLGPSSGAFFVDYFGVGHLVRLPAFRSTSTLPHAVAATVEVMVP